MVQISDWDEAYKNGAYINNAEEYLPGWAKKAAEFRAAHPAIEITYGDHERQSIDLFKPENPKGLLVFVHGGYWRSMDRSLWSHLAAGAIQNGWAVAIPGYILAPENSIADITRQIALAIDTVAKNVNGPIHLAGHSAGGHLVTRMGCADVALACAPRVKNIVSISGVHDLRPIEFTTMNTDLKLDLASATAESPVFMTPRNGFCYAAWVGADERPEFIRQSRLMADIWVSNGISSDLVIDPNKHHFDVIDGLESPKSPLTKTVLTL